VQALPLGEILRFQSVPFARSSRAAVRVRGTRPAPCWRQDQYHSLWVLSSDFTFSSFNWHAHDQAFVLAGGVGVILSSWGELPRAPGGARGFPPEPARPRAEVLLLRSLGSD
jgi:hypothetical protein